MAVLRSNRQRLEKTLSSQEVVQRIVRVGCKPSPLPEPGLLFDLVFEGVPWAAQLREESCRCPHPGGLHRHRLLICGELHAALEWRRGALLAIERGPDGRLWIQGDLSP